MLTIKNKIMLLKLTRLVHKRNKAFVNGDFGKATHYGELVDDYITNVLKM